MLQFYPSPYSRTLASLPEARLINLYFETTPMGPGPVAMLQRPGLVVEETRGAGPIRGLLLQNGVFSENLFSVSGNTVYRGGSSLGTIGVATGLCELSASADHVVLIDYYGGAKAYAYDGATFAQITDADLPSSLSSACYYFGRWYYAQRDTGVFYWSDIADPTSIDGLSFATAEGSPDETLNIFALGDDLVVAGVDSVEFFYATDDADAPVARYTNRSYTIGCGFKWTLQKADNTFFFVGSDGVPYSAGSVPQSLIDPQSGQGYGVMEALRGADRDETFAFIAEVQGHVFWVICIPGVKTFAYDIATRRWSEWTSNGDASFRVSCATSDQGLTYMGSDSDGKIYNFDPAAYEDDGDPMERICSAFVSSDDVQRFDRLRVTTTGSAEADIDLRTYDTAWSSWQTATTVNGKADYRRLGSMKSPGRHLECRTTANANVSFVGFDVNPPRP